MFKMLIPWCVLQEFDLEDTKQALRNLNVFAGRPVDSEVGGARLHLFTSLGQNEHFEGSPENPIFFSIPTHGFFHIKYSRLRASHMVLVVKISPANAGDVRDTGSISGSGGSHGGTHGNPLQYSCLENPMDIEAFQKTVHRVAKSCTQLKQLSTHKHSRLDAVSKPLKYLKVFLRQTMQYLRFQGLLLFSCPTLCNPMDNSTPGFPVLHYILGFAQIHVHSVGDAI